MHDFLTTSVFNLASCLAYTSHEVSLCLLPCLLIHFCLDSFIFFTPLSLLYPSLFWSSSQLDVKLACNKTIQTELLETEMGWHGLGLELLSRSS